MRLNIVKKGVQGDYGNKRIKVAVTIPMTIKAEKARNRRLESWEGLKGCRRGEVKFTS